MILSAHARIRMIERLVPRVAPNLVGLPISQADAESIAAEFIAAAPTRQRGKNGTVEIINAALGVYAILNPRTDTVVTFGAIPNQSTHHH